ncbi:MAG: prepilin-type N-terminal cleavage/methylation domain-containing protein [Fibrobacter sp.]|nr:prepilin-type N-terminal cleavage/methylation domain-containing protein [Fibrobacter sp.]
MSLKSGFTLLELLVAMTAASIVALSAYAFLGQNVRSYNVVLGSYADESAALIRRVQETQRKVFPVLPQDVPEKKKRADRMIRPN